MRRRAVTFLAVLGLVATACSSTPAATVAPSSAPTAAPATAAPATAAPATAAPATAAPASAAASGGASARDTLNIVWLGDCTCIWHPAAYETFSQAVNFELMYSNLIDHVWKDENTVEFTGDLAESWSTPDAKVYTFKLRQGVKWHDGQPFTADDVIWTINESMKWTPGRFKNTSWDTLVGAKDVIAGKAQTVAGAKKIDDNTVELTLENPDADWLNEVTEPNAVILPQHVLKDLLNGVAKDKVQSTIETSDFAVNHPIGTGPYKFVKYETDQYSQFEANPDYFQGAPKIKNIFVKRLKGDAAVAGGEAGEVDLAVRLNPADAERVQKAPNLDTILSNGVSTFGPQFNLVDANNKYDPDHARCDPECRRAVSYGVDAPGIIANIYGGRGKLNKGVNPGMPDADGQELFEYSPDKCKEHLAKSSWDKSKPLRIVFDNTFAGVTLWTPVMQQNLEACGFKVDLRGFETTAAIEEYNKLDDYEILLMQGTDQGVSPFKQEGYYNCKLNTPAVWAGAYLRDCANVDDAFERVRAEPDPAKQTEIFKAIELVLNKAVDKVSWWTLQALNFKSKCLQGPLVPKNTREFIVSKPWTWTFTC